MPQNDRSRRQVFETEVEPLLGAITEVRYEYPVEVDYFRRDIEPLLHRYGLNFLETSSAGNCFGAFWTQPDGSYWRGGIRSAGSVSFWGELDQGPGISRWDPDNYAGVDDPHGRQPILPTLANPMVVFDDEPDPVPFVCSNKISTFSILDTRDGVVRSFAFDVRQPAGEVIKFDQFSLDD